LESMRQSAHPWSGSPLASHVWQGLSSVMALQVQREHSRATNSVCCTTDRHAQCRPILSPTPCAQNEMRVMNTGTGRKPSRTTARSRSPELSLNLDGGLLSRPYDRYPTVKRGSGAGSFYHIERHADRRHVHQRCRMSRLSYPQTHPFHSEAFLSRCLACLHRRNLSSYMSILVHGSATLSISHQHRPCKTAAKLLP
jgi:hypothetical protein